MKSLNTFIHNIKDLIEKMIKCFKAYLQKLVPIGSGRWGWQLSPSINNGGGALIPLTPHIRREHLKMLVSTLNA